MKYSDLPANVIVIGSGAISDELASLLENALSKLGESSFRFFDIAQNGPVSTKVLFSKDPPLSVDAVSLSKVLTCREMANDLIAVSRSEARYEPSEAPLGRIKGWRVEIGTIGVINAVIVRAEWVADHQEDLG